MSSLATPSPARRLLLRAGSLTLAVAVLVAFLLALAAGTVVESRTSVEAARRLVYGAPWFLALQGLLALNVAASLASLFPWGRARLGYALAHAGVLVVLAGGLASAALRTEGVLGVWEGDSSAEIELPRQDGPPEVRALPFRVTLDDFQLDTHPGTTRPSMFRSVVRVAELDGSGEFPAVIEMNRPLAHRGWRLFQSSYRERGGREASVLSVSRDPGQPVVFAGYGLLLLGMCLVLARRVAARRAALRDLRQGAPAAAAGPGGPAALAVAALVAAVTWLAVHQAPSLAGAPAPAGGAGEAGAELEALRRLPVQHDGRSMPLDTLARDLVWSITGERSVGGEDPVATIARWLDDPPAAVAEPALPLPSEALAEALGLPGRARVAYGELMEDPSFARLLGEVRAAASGGRPRRGLLADAETFAVRAGHLRRLLAEEAIRPVPVDGGGAWGVPESPVLPELAELARGPRLAGWPGAEEVAREVALHRVRPARLAWMVLASALLLATLAWARPRRGLDLAAFAALAAGTGVMTWGLAVRWQVGGRIPAANMYESLLVLAWGAGLVAVIASVATRSRLVLLNASAAAAVTMALVDLLPIDRFVRPVAPVLAGTFWLAVHVPIIMVGYAVLGLGVVAAHVQLGAAALGARGQGAAARAADLLSWYTRAGGLLLLAGILTGSMWAAGSWGRTWGWDPKEVWSLVAFLAYMAILHARAEQLIGEAGVAALSIAAFQAILMTYLGVNYVLTTGLHSYGFGDTPIMSWMVAGAAAEVLFVGAALAASAQAPSSATSGQSGATAR